MYIMHIVKIPVEVDFRCEMATKVSLWRLFPGEVTAFNKPLLSLLLARPHPLLLLLLLLCLSTPTSTARYLCHAGRMMGIKENFAERRGEDDCEVAGVPASSPYSPVPPCLHYLFIIASRLWIWPSLSLI